MMPDTKSDHEILLEVQWELRQMRESLVKILPELTMLKLFEQKTDLTITTLTNNFSRAMLSADEGRKTAQDAMVIGKTLEKEFGDHLHAIEPDLKAFHELQVDVIRLRTYIRVGGAIVFIIQLITIPIVVEAVKQWLFH